VTDLLTTGTSQDEANRGSWIAVLPIGSFEHSDHLPLITDTIIACVIAREIAEAYDLFLLPLITISRPHEHAAWAGTVNISTATLYMVISIDVPDTGDHMTSSWADRNHDGPIVSGWSVITRTQEEAEALLKELRPVGVAPA
jgi:hypothetical protein